MTWPLFREDTIITDAEMKAVEDEAERRDRQAQLLLDMIMNDPELRALTLKQVEQMKAEAAKQESKCKHGPGDGCLWCCETCNYDRHHCPGCGAVSDHHNTPCPECEDL